MNDTDFQVCPEVEPHSGQVSTVHLALDDATGDSMIIEYAGGKPNVYHGRDLAVMTNSPPYPQQLELLLSYQGFGGDRPLPGTGVAADRFVRASYYLRNLPKPGDRRMALAALLSVLRNTSQPFGDPDPTRAENSSTIWRTLADLTNRLYFFESSFSPYLIWVGLEDFDLSVGAPAMRLDLHAERDLSGEVADQFVATPRFEFLMPMLG
jgi:penicillin V acylase-like amidase (Ntn superfamily)